MAPEPEYQQGVSVPFWALPLATDVAAIKARVDRLPVIEHELETMRAEQVPLAEHKTVVVKVDSMWDAWQRSIGSHARDRVWLATISIAVAILGGIQTLHTLGIVK